MIYLLRCVQLLRSDGKARNCSHPKEFIIGQRRRPSVTGGAFEKMNKKVWSDVSRGREPLRGQLRDDGKRG